MRGASGAGGYQIARSLRFNRADSAYLNRTPASASNRKTWTWSAWVKRGQITSGQTQTLFAAGSSTSTGFHFINSTDILELYDFSGSYNWQLNTTQVFRDPSAWYHFVVAFDTTQATASNRIKLYVNGTQVTSFSTATYPTQNADYQINNNVATYVGRTGLGTIYDFDGYQTEVNFIDGQALTPSSFGETNAQTGVWQPKAYSGSYGTNGFYLNFSDNSNTTAATLGKDYSGNGNNWTPNNFSVTAGAGNDSLVDSPTSYGTDTGVGGEVRGNYATWNAILQTLGGTASTYTNGNLVASSTSSNWVLGTIRINDAKYYFELVPDSAASGLYLGINSTTDVRITAYSGGIEASPGGGSNQGSLASWSNGDIIGVAVDGPNKTVQFYRNGSTYGTLVTYTTALDLWPFARNGGAGSSQVTANFGQRPFAYTAPSGFKALCTQNLPTPTIGATAATQANKNFTTVLYTGTGSNLPVTVGFQPDWIWTKARSAVDNNVVVDVNRGIGTILITNNNAVESAYGAFVSFDSNGFTKAALESVSSRTYAAWNWKAGGTAVTNTSGSISSQVSANPSAGFSVVTWNGTGAASATIGHGLGAAPTMIIAKERNFAGDWFVYHISLGNTYIIRLNTQANSNLYAPMWNSTTPTSSVFSTAYLCSTSITYIAYCFAPIAGYSAFGSYTGNQSADGPFVYTGFRPAFLMTKDSTNGSTNWYIHDSARGTYNVNIGVLFPNATYVEEPPPGLSVDFLSNGFKPRKAGDGFNTSGATHIYMAFAENPFKYSLGR